MIFSLFIMVAAFEANKVFAAILVMINILLPSLGLSILGVYPGFFPMLVAYSEFAVSLLGLYCAGAVFLNTYFGGCCFRWASPSDSSMKGPAGQIRGSLQAVEVPVLKKALRHDGRRKTSGTAKFNIPGGIIRSCLQALHSLRRPDLEAPTHPIIEPAPGRSLKRRSDRADR